MQRNTQQERANERGPARAEEDRGTEQEASESIKLGFSSTPSSKVPRRMGKIRKKRCSDRLVMAQSQMHRAFETESFRIDF